QELDRSNDGQDHTVLPYARPAISPQFSQPCRRGWKLTGETNLTAPLVRTRFGLTESNPPRPSPLVHDAAASTASPAREHDDHTIAPQEMSRDGRHIRQIRISVKWNIFEAGD
ncbi:hypothetical protein ABIA41_000001, partial [Bradyrhizobium sp. USDA 313]